MELMADQRETQLYCIFPYKIFRIEPYMKVFSTLMKKGCGF